MRIGLRPSEYDVNAPYCIPCIMPASRGKPKPRPTAVVDYTCGDSPRLGLAQGARGGRERKRMQLGTIYQDAQAGNAALGLGKLGKVDGPYINAPIAQRFGRAHGWPPSKRVP